MRGLLLYIILIFIFSFCYYGCLKNNVPTSPAFSLNNSAELLYYLEGAGNYINSDEMPSLISVDTVYLNSDDYLLIDIRSSAQFNAGHISQAVNIPHAAIIDFIDSADVSPYDKIILISQNGQSSAFYTCLLRLYGFSNAYSMSYGMAAWNQTFSNEWLSALQEDDSLLVFYSAFPSPKPAISPLPEVDLQGESIPGKVKRRIKEISLADFEDNLSVSEGVCTIDYIKFIHNLNDYFSICYGSTILYKDFIPGIMHPINAVLYDPPPNGSELRSTAALQTIPVDSTIIVYSTDGQLSAFAVAYLRVLGYNAKSLLFGANNMFYYRLLSAPNLNEEAFSQSMIRDYPYVTGN